MSQKIIDTIRNLFAQKLNISWLCWLIQRKRCFGKQNKLMKNTLSKSINQKLLSFVFRFSLCLSVFALKLVKMPPNGRKFGFWTCELQKNSWQAHLLSVILLTWEFSLLSLWFPWISGGVKCGWLLWRTTYTSEASWRKAAGSPCWLSWTWWTDGWRKPYYWKFKRRHLHHEKNLSA